MTKPKRPEKYSTPNFSRLKSASKPMKFDFPRQKRGHQNRAAATGVNRWPNPASAPSRKTTSKAADVVVSSERSTSRLLVFAKTTIRNVPIKAVSAIVPNTSLRAFPKAK